MKIKPEKKWSLLRVLITAAALGFIFPAAPLHALTLSLETEFSGGQIPAGPPPWLTATFTDVSGGAELMLKSRFTAGEFVSKWYFSLDPSLNPAALSFTFASGTGASSIQTGTDAFKADGDGRFDILFSFPTALSSTRFDGTDMATYTITCAACGGLGALSFEFPSASTVAGKSFFSAAHVQGIGAAADGSGWIGARDPSQTLLIAEPDSLFFSAIGLAALYLSRRKWRTGA